MCMMSEETLSWWRAQRKCRLVSARMHSLNPLISAFRLCIDPGLIIQCAIRVGLPWTKHTVNTNKLIYGYEISEKAVEDITYKKVTTYIYRSHVEVTLKSGERVTMHGDGGWINIRNPMPKLRYEMPLK